MLILVLGHVLYFSDEMEHSLLSPNQVGSFAHNLCLNPNQYTNGTSKHCIYSESENVIVPFSMHGCISYIPIQHSAPEELDDCRHIYLTAEEEWRPMMICLLKW
jgi:hypothetical protein